REKPATSSASWATAAGASSPEAEIVSSEPPSAPRPRISRMLLPFACLPFARTSIVAAKEEAARTNAPAGRACSATARGRRTSSELSRTPRLLGSNHHIRERHTRGRRHARRDRAFDERPIRQHHIRLAVELGERSTYREQRAAEIDEHDSARAAVGPAE